MKSQGGKALTGGPAFPGGPLSPCKIQIGEAEPYASHFPKWSQALLDGPRRLSSGSSLQSWVPSASHFLG